MINIILFIVLVITFPVWFPLFLGGFVGICLVLCWLVGGQIAITKNERKIGTLRWFKYMRCDNDQQQTRRVQE